jgi:hypothetical protein
MAKLSEQEKSQLLSAAQRKMPRPPSLPSQPVRDFVAFATFASGLKPVPTAVRFIGKDWKL